MARYLLIESRDLLEYTGSRYILNVATGLRQRGNEVTVFLVENGVVSAREGSSLAGTLSDLSQQGVRVLAEDVSLTARAISQTGAGIQVSTMDELADLVVSGSDKVIWY